MERGTLRMLRAQLSKDHVLSRPYMDKILRLVGNAMREEEKLQNDKSLHAFLADEMAKCVDILKLRKLAMCRLGYSAYADYREKYFDGKNNR